MFNTQPYLLSFQRGKQMRQQNKTGMDIPLHKGFFPQNSFVTASFCLNFRLLEIMLLIFFKKMLHYCMYNCI